MRGCARPKPRTNNSYRLTASRVRIEVEQSSEGSPKGIQLSSGAVLNRRATAATVRAVQQRSTATEATATNRHRLEATV